MALKGDGRTEEDVSHSLFGHLPPGAEEGDEIEEEQEEEDRIQR